MGVPPDDGDIDLTDQIQHRQNGVAVTGALLVVGGAEHGHQDPQDNAQDQGQGGHQQGGLDAVEVLQPAVPLNKGLVKLDEEILEKTQVSASNADGFPCGIEFLHIGRSPLSFYGLREERKRAAHAALF